MHDFDLVFDLFLVGSQLNEIENVYCIIVNVSFSK